MHDALTLCTCTDKSHFTPLQRFFFFLLFTFWEKNCAPPHFSSLSYAVVFKQQINGEKFLFVQQIQCHMVIRTFNQLNVLILLVPF